MPGWLFWLYLPYHVALNAYSFLMLALAGRGEVILWAKIDAIRGLGRALSKRRRIQKARKTSPRELLRVMKRGAPRPSYRGSTLLAQLRLRRGVDKDLASDGKRTSADHVIGSGKPL